MEVEVLDDVEVDVEVDELVLVDVEVDELVEVELLDDVKVKFAMATLRFANSDISRKFANNYSY